MNPTTATPTETHAQLTERATKAGRNAAAFAATLGTDETPHAQAGRRKQQERCPNLWADAFLAGYAAEERGE